MTRKIMLSACTIFVLSYMVVGSYTATMVASAYRHSLYAYDLSGLTPPRHGRVNPNPPQPIEPPAPSSSVAPDEEEHVLTAVYRHAKAPLVPNAPTPEHPGTSQYGTGISDPLYPGGPTSWFRLWIDPTAPSFIKLAAAVIIWMLGFSMYCIARFSAQIVSETLARLTPRFHEGS